MEENEAYSQSNKPSAPPPDLKINGYENIGFEDFLVMPQPINPDELKKYEPTKQREFNQAAFISDSEAREALLEYVNSKCCYGMKPAKEMQIIDSSSSSTLRYVVQTFTEGRSTKWAYEAYYGEPIINTGFPPGPWDILVTPEILFKDSVVQIEVPNTSSVRSCGDCYGSGSRTCWSCNGRGHSHCNFCSGNGRRDGQCCNYCNGRGRNACVRCHSSGRETCTTCLGTGRLRWFIKLIVKFENNLEDFFKGQESVPVEELRNCVAEKIFSEENIRIYPLSNYPDPQINMVSQQIVNSHTTKFNDKRILMQMHELNVIPITRCVYKFKEKTYNFHVYGLNRAVHEIDYPHNCCGCCFCVVL
jgi:hypothetical protein